jgi:hypothetical protein
MHLVCGGCAGWVKAIIDRAEGTIRCPECSALNPGRLLPLFIVTGASGVGKTAIIAGLRPLLPGWEIFETDILWDSGGSWSFARDNWLRIAYSIAQGGRPTILCGNLLPEDIARCDYADAFSRIHYLLLHCTDEERTARLNARPAWRGCDSTFVANQQQFAAWLLAEAAPSVDPSMPVIDTTDNPRAASQVREWALAGWRAYQEAAGAENPAATLPAVPNLPVVGEGWRPASIQNGEVGDGQH